MAEYIDKKSLITEIQSAVSMVLQTAPYEKVWFDRFADRQNEILEIIERQPAAEVEPVRHGRWTRYREDIYFCSLCRVASCVKEVTRKPAWDYCPACGAKMEGDNSDDWHRKDKAHQKKHRHLLGVRGADWRGFGRDTHRCAYGGRSRKGRKRMWGG